MKIRDNVSVDLAKRRHNQMLEDKKSARIAREQAMRKARAKRLLDIIFYVIQAIGGSRPYEFIFSCCPLVSTILSVLKLDHSIDVSWPVAMAPMFFLVANFIYQPLIYVIALFIVYYLDPHDGREDFRVKYDDRGWIRPMLFRYAFYMVTYSESLFVPLAGLGIFTSVAVLVGLPMIWFANSCVGDMGCSSPGIYYFIPLMVGLLVLSLVSGFALIGTSDTRIDGIFITPIPIFLIIGIITVMLNADGFVEWSWGAAMSPFFICIAWIIIADVSSVVMGCVWERWYRRHSALGGELSIFRITLIVTFFLILLPIAVFLIFLAINLDGYLDVSYSLLMIPFYVFTGLFVIAYIFMYCLLHG